MNQQQDNRPDMRSTFNIGYLIVNGHALTLTTFMRTDFGKEGIGVYGLAGFAIILLYGGMTGCTAMVGYLGVWFLSCVCQRIKQFKNWRNGTVIHSRYNGYPLLVSRLFPKMRELNMKGVEAFICLPVGWLLAQINPALGMYVMAGFGSILMSEALIVQRQKKRLQDMADAEMEQRALSEDLKRLRR